MEYVAERLPVDGEGFEEFVKIFEKFAHVEDNKEVRGGERERGREGDRGREGHALTLRGVNSMEERGREEERREEHWVGGSKAERHRGSCCPHHGCHAGRHVP